MQDIWIWVTAWPPHVGLSIALLAFVAVIVAVRTEHWGRREKILWIVAGFVLLLAEIYAMQHQQQVDQATVRAEKDEREERATKDRVAEDNRFATILEQTQRQFSSTRSKIEGVGSIAKKALIASTGDGSYVMITGQKQNPRDDNSPMQLVISNPTKIVAKDVGISVFPSFIGATKIPDDPRFTYRTLGDVPPGTPPRYSDIYVPSGNYEIWINSASGMFWEYLQMSKCKNGTVPSLLKIRAVNSGEWLHNDSLIKPCPD